MLNIIHLESQFSKSKLNYSGTDYNTHLQAFPHEYRTFTLEKCTCSTEGFHCTACLYSMLRKSVHTNATCEEPGIEASSVQRCLFRGSLAPGILCYLQAFVATWVSNVDIQKSGTFLKSHLSVGMQLITIKHINPQVIPTVLSTLLQRLRLSKILLHDIKVFVCHYTFIARPFPTFTYQLAILI